MRNLSKTGALIEGLWNVPSGTVFSVHLADGYVVAATTRWCSEGRMGVEFAAPVQLSGVAGLRPANEAMPGRTLRRQNG